jgi:hypothetical protein
MMCQTEGCYRTTGVKPLIMKFSNGERVSFLCPEHCAEMISILNKLTRGHGHKITPPKSLGFLGTLMRVWYALKRGFKFC